MYKLGSTSGVKPSQTSNNYRDVKADGNSWHSLSIYHLLDSELDLPEPSATLQGELLTSSQDRRQHEGPERTDPLSKDTGQQGMDLNLDLSVSRVPVLPASACGSSSEREVSLHHRGIEKEGHRPVTGFRSPSGLLGKGGTGRGHIEAPLTHPSECPLQSD